MHYSTINTYVKHLQACDSNYFCYQIALKINIKKVFLIFTTTNYKPWRSLLTTFVATIIYFYSSLVLFLKASSNSSHYTRLRTQLYKDGSMPYRVAHSGLGKVESDICYGISNFSFFKDLSISMRTLTNFKINNCVRKEFFNNCFFQSWHLAH